MRSSSESNWIKQWTYGLALAALLGVATGCSGDSSSLQFIAAESCMSCHNASLDNDYAGPGIENPHPFGTADNLRCTTCHGGNGEGGDKLASHVPPPPQIGDDQNLEDDRTAYFNRLTLTGIDKFPDYQAHGQTFSALDYLQFINPGDLRVVDDGRACGQCHAGHVDTVTNSLLATSAGIFSGAMYAIGVDNAVPENQGLYEHTAADLGFRAEQDPEYQMISAGMGAVGRVLEFPVFSVFGAEGPTDIHNNDLYDSDELPNYQLPNNQVMTDSPLANLYAEQVAFTCGDCHLGSAGANNRYGDFRSSGCTACHMQYSLDGRSGSGDPNMDPEEPQNPDNIRAPERSHVKRHVIRSVAKTLPSGELLAGIDDYSCAGCHQGSNRTVMQYWGIRLDQNEDLEHGVQYPANPVSYVDTRDDTRLFDPVVNNRTFNGREDDQYILFEDYDGDARDDTPPDVHYEAGLGCIDCHGSYDLHGGTPGDGKVQSRMEQAVAIRCESCHGGVDAYAPTTPGVSYAGEAVEVAQDSAGNPLRHVIKESDGHYYLYSRLTGQRHYVSQTLDVVVDSGRVNTLTNQPLYSVKGSYAMGRDDDTAATGIGPQQDGAQAGFSHMDSMDCASCHASWTNSCIGCHLGGEYDTNPRNHSNITGERIVFEQANADFVYQSPVPFQLGISADNKISNLAPNTETFWQYEDRHNDDSKVFAFSDRNGRGNNPAAGNPSLSHNAMMPHSIRGKVTANNEGPRYCVSCHLTDEGLTNYGTQYDTLRTAMSSGDYSTMDVPFFQTLQTHIGSNPGNQLNSPLWVHMVAGLGSGLFLFDEHGCPVNPLDTNADRVGCDGEAPASTFDLDRVFFNLDRIVDENGESTGSSNHPLFAPGTGPNLRDGALNPAMSGPLGLSLTQRLTDPTAGIVLDTWINADGAQVGDSANYSNGP